MPALYINGIHPGEQMSSIMVNIRMAPAVRDTLDGLSWSHGLSRSAVIRRALGIMAAVDEAKADGRYVGSTRDRESLETIIIAPL